MNAEPFWFLCDMETPAGPPPDSTPTPIAMGASAATGAPPLRHWNPMHRLKPSAAASSRDARRKQLGLGLTSPKKTKARVKRLYAQLGPKLALQCRGARRLPGNQILLEFALAVAEQLHWSQVREKVSRACSVAIAPAQARGQVDMGVLIRWDQPVPPTLSVFHMDI